MTSLVASQLPSKDQDEPIGSLSVTFFFIFICQGIGKGVVIKVGWDDTIRGGGGGGGRR